MTDILVNYVDHMGSDLSVVNAARVSFDKESTLDCKQGLDCCQQPVGCEGKLSDKDTKLIQFLARGVTTADFESFIDLIEQETNRDELVRMLWEWRKTPEHKSPFNHTFASFRVQAPIFVARQLVKHEYMPWNEVSRRYVDSKPEFYKPEKWRKRATNVKQGSGEEGVSYTKIIDIHGNNSTIIDVYDDWIHEAIFMYEQLIEKGVCPEQARIVLPASLMTEWIWSGTLFAIAKMYNLRIDPHTQQETRQVAKFIGDKMSELYPVSWKALTNASSY